MVWNKVVLIIIMITLEFLYPLVKCYLTKKKIYCFLTFIHNFIAYYNDDNNTIHIINEIKPLIAVNISLIF